MKLIAYIEITGSTKKSPKNLNATIELNGIIDLISNNPKNC